MAESNPVTKDCDHMKNQLRGIALILFGILLAIVGIADELFSAGDFLMFFLGLEMASVPMGCMAALDKWRNDSAEAAAKFILTATFSSGVMLYGISFLYGATGTLYFEDFSKVISKKTEEHNNIIF